MQFSLLYKQRWSWLYIPIVLLSGILISLAVTEWMPLPPLSVNIVVGDQPGNHEQLAKRYRDVLEQKHIHANIVQTQNWNELSQALQDSAQTAQLGFAKGFYAKNASPNIQAIAVVAREPVWVFSRVATVSQIAQMAGLRISTGPEDSASRKVAKLLLDHAGATNVVWQTTSFTAAANDLVEGKSDAMIHIGGADSPVVKRLSRTAGIQVLGVQRAVALSAREPSLRPFALPQGAIELVGNIPPADLTLQANLTHLLVRDTLHPALQRLLNDVATEVHERPTFLQHHAEFPNTHDVDFELSPTAKSYSLGDKPFFEALLPYWWAQLAQLLVLAILPILLITWYVLALIPALFDLRVNATLHHFYGELKFLENDMAFKADKKPVSMSHLMQRLDAIERNVSALDLPDIFTSRWYTLREHLATVRYRLFKNRES